MYTASLYVLLTLSASAGFSDPGWYKLVFKNEHVVVVNILDTSEDDSSYVCSYFGKIFEISVSDTLLVVDLDTVWKSGRDRSILEPKRERAVREALNHLGSTDPDLVFKARVTLDREFPGCRPHLNEGLRHPSKQARVEIFKILAKRGSVDLDLEAVRGGLRDAEEDVRLVAIEAIAEFGPDTLKTLMDHLPVESSVRNRKEAIKIVRDWKDDRSVKPLVSLLAFENDPGVQSFIVSALKKITRKNFSKDASAWRAFLEEADRKIKVLGTNRNDEDPQDVESKLQQPHLSNLPL